MQTGKIGRQFRPELKDFAAQRVLYPQNMGMQGLPAKGSERRSGFWWQKGGFRAESGPIDLITHERMADRGQMHPNLVGPAGFQPTNQEARDRGIGLFGRTLRRFAGLL